MGIFKIGMDQVSLAALMIALGMLVDNAIVMCESTVVAMESGKSAFDAAMDSCGRVKDPASHLFFNHYRCFYAL